MGVARIFQRGGHTDSYRGYSSDCHLNIVSCLLTRRLTKGGSRAPQDPPPPGYAYVSVIVIATESLLKPNRTRRWDGMNTDLSEWIVNPKESS